MTAYFLKLIVMLPLVGGMAFAALWLWRRVQPGLALSARARSVKLIDTLPMGTAGRLTVVDFADRRLLIAVSRGRIELISEVTVPATFALPDSADRD